MQAYHHSVSVLESRQTCHIETARACWKVGRLIWHIETAWVCWKVGRLIWHIETAWACWKVGRLIWHIETAWACRKVGRLIWHIETAWACWKVGAYLAYWDSVSVLGSRKTYLECRVFGMAWSKSVSARIQATRHASLWIVPDLRSIPRWVSFAFRGNIQTTRIVVEGKIKRIFG
jgi:hypothetical protein